MGVGVTIWDFISLYIHVYLFLPVVIGIKFVTEFMTIEYKWTNLESYSGPTLRAPISVRHLRVTFLNMAVSKNWWGIENARDKETERERYYDGDEKKEECES